MTFDLHSLVRPNIRRLKPYSSARSEFEGSAEVFLDANENSFGSPAGDGFNRYPDPLQKELKRKIGKIYDVDTFQIFVGNGSDEAIDLLFRIFCQPGKDACIVCPPTYGMYQVSADINDVHVFETPLTSDFQLDVDAVLRTVSRSTKLIFICSPNNPTGNLMRREDVIRVAREFSGVVVVDEAYIHFAAAESMLKELPQLPNLIILQTFSKAWGMAGLRVGLTFASAEIIEIMNRVKPPYNVSEIAQRAVSDALELGADVDTWVWAILNERARLIGALNGLEFVQTVYPSDANFVLLKTEDANAIYSYLIDEKIVVRNRDNVELCSGCLRVTVGTAEENDRLLTALDKYSRSRN